jgi:hypothetical protein
MIRSSIAITVLLVVSYAVAMQPAGQEMPPNHPQIPTGHPPVGEQATPADPEDVKSVDAIITAYYDTLSAEKDEERNWGRFLSLFADDARFVSVRTVRDRTSAMSLTPEQFVQFNQSYFAGSGYHESEVNRVTEEFGNIAHAFSTYASRHTVADEAPYSRGINSIQLMTNGERWWIVTVMWDYERPGDGLNLPDEYLGAEGEAAEAESVEAPAG